MQSEVAGNERSFWAIFEKVECEEISAMFWAMVMSVAERDLLLSSTCIRMLLLGVKR